MKCVIVNKDIKGLVSYIRIGIQNSFCFVSAALTYKYSVLIFLQAIEDLTKALEFEPDSPDILHERGSTFKSSVPYFRFKNRLLE